MIDQGYGGDMKNLENRINSLENKLTELETRIERLERNTAGSIYINGPKLEDDETHLSELGRELKDVIDRIQKAIRELEDEAYGED